MSWTCTEPPSADELEALYSPSAWQAGEDYVGLERVPTRLVAGGILAGAVHGQRADYWVRIGPDGTSCSTCSRPCRHGAALAVAFLRAPETFVDVPDLVHRYLHHGTPDVLVEGLLRGNVLESLETFTEGVFIPPFDEARDLARLAFLDREERHRAVARLGRQGRLALLARVLAAPLDFDPLRLARIYLEEPSPPDSPLLPWLAAHAAEADLDAVLDLIVGLVSLDREHASELLSRACRLLAAMPGGPEVLPGALEAGEARSDVLEEAARLLAAAGRPREAMRIIDRALLTSRADRRLRLLELGIALAAAEGSPREAVWRLDALRLGDAAQLSVIRRRFPDLFDEEAPDLVCGERAIEDANLRSLTALAAGLTSAAVDAARKAPLPPRTLTRIIRQAARGHLDVSGIRLDHLGHGDRSRLGSLILKAGEEPPARRMPARKD